MRVPLETLSVAFVSQDAERASGAVDAPRRAPATDEPAMRHARLEQWFRDHFDTLWRLAARLGVPNAQVDDVVQEAFIVADRRATEIKPGAERGFLIGVVVRASANQRRKERIRLDYASQGASEPEPSASPDAERMLAHKQLRQLLDVALDELPSEQRSVLVLHEIEGLSGAEIAHLLDLPPGTVASRLARARARFSKAAARLRAKWPEHR